MKMWSGNVRNITKLNQKHNKLERKMSKFFVRAELITHNKKNILMNCCWIYCTIQSNSICSSGSIFYRMFPSSCLVRDEYTIWSCVLICEYEYQIVSSSLKRQDDGNIIWYILPGEQIGLNNTFNKNSSELIFLCVVRDCFCTNWRCCQAVNAKTTWCHAWEKSKPNKSSCSIGYINFFWSVTSQVAILQVLVQ